MDRDGYEEGTFNTHFLNLSVSDKKKNLEIAKAIPFAKTNEELVEYSFAPKVTGKESFWTLLMGMKSTGLKDDGLLSVFYEMIAEKYQATSDYGIYLFYGTYDIPVKATDKERLDDSLEVYDFIICSIAPLLADYELGEPQFGFLFPAFSDRSSDYNQIDIFQAATAPVQGDVIKQILGE